MKRVDLNIKDKAETAAETPSACDMRQATTFDRLANGLCAGGRFLFWSAAFVVMLPFAVTALAVTGRS
jgi:hypothetical protein